MFEVALCEFYDSPALEKRGPFATTSEAAQCIMELNKNLPKGGPTWYWAPIGVIPMANMPLTEMDGRPFRDYEG